MILRFGRCPALDLYMTVQTVLIVSGSADFSAEVTARWNQERKLLQCATLKPESFLAAHVPCDLVVIGPLPQPLLAAVLHHAEKGGSAALCLCGDDDAAELLRRYPGVIALRRQEAWLDLLLQIGNAILRGAAAAARARRAEQQVSAMQHHAALGRYMLEMRHNLNNSLTSVLGNAELLMLESARLPQPMRDQLDALHSMTMRMNAVLQRFSSLDMEMRFAARATEAAPAAELAAAAREPEAVTA
jgi:signal transduction histidine kinase